MHNNHLTNNSNQPKPQRLSEALQYKDLEGMMKSTVHVDEFSAKMGDDDDIIVISFFVRDKAAARDLMNWFEKGYDFVLDADKSPGEIKPGRYLVYVELRRRSTAPGNVQRLLSDLNTLTEFDTDDWTLHYDGKHVPFTEEAFAAMIPCTPDAYRKSHNDDLNEMRVAAGLETKKIHEIKPDVASLQSMAGIR